jgi:hypothetical protein
LAIADRLFIEHGATTMPSVTKVPLAIEAPTLRSSCRTLARAATLSGSRSIS